MNQLMGTTDFDKLRFLKAHLSEDHFKAYKADFGNDKELSFSYYNFVPFCHMYAEYLLINGSYNIYESFVNQFNHLIEKDNTHKLMKDIQNSQLGQLGGLGFLNTNYNKVFIKDKRPPIKNREFVNESDLEQIIETELKDFFGNEIDVKRQQKHGYGKSDITIENKVTIELKKSIAKRMNVYQAFEYSFDENLDDVCLLTSKFDEKTLSIANKLNVGCYTYSFVYEENINEYPIGFVIEKENHTRKNLFDEYLEAVDECFWISFYDPSFKSSESFNRNKLIVDEINKLTNAVHENTKNKILKDLEKQGYDISLGLEKLLEKINEERII